MTKHVMFRSKTAAIAGLIGLALCGASVAVLNEVGSSQQTRNHERKELQLDIVKRVKMLSVLAELSGQHHLRSSIMIHGSFKAEVDEAVSIANWKQVVGIRERLTPRMERGRQVYRGQYVTSAWKGDILLYQDGEARIYYTIKLSGQAKGGVSESAVEGERLLQAMSSYPYFPEWSATVQTISKSNAVESFAIAEKALHEWGVVKPLDRYSDKRTISVSYESDYMGQGVQMNNSNANLQVAVHEDQEAGETRVSFGTPLIAGEF
ncbi:YwmB family TATA-box binding protein [Paenibacillus sp. 481]|nr:YwmB family TATA-box binding protein [Paenibacillus sp. 481]